MKIKIYLLIFSFLFMILLFYYQNTQFNDGRLHVVFCNVGQGDAVYIRTPGGSDILLDAGPDSSVLNCLSKHMPFWDKDIELVILSHPHADHVLGLASVLSSYKVLNLGLSGQTSKNLPKELSYLIAEHGTPETKLEKGSIVKIGGILFKVLWPEKQFASNDPNQISEVILLSYGLSKFFLPGDAGSQTLNKIVSGLGRADVLKIPHHGSKTGIDGKELDVLSPKLSVISVGKNSYGHPSKTVLNLLDERKMKYLRTDFSGDIEVESNGKSLIFNP